MYTAADPLGRPQVRSSWLTLGKVYHVLSIVFDANGQWLVRVRTDDALRVGLFRREQFEVLSTRIPANLIAKWNESLVFEMMRDAWSREDFWDRYERQDPGTLRVFEQEREAIIESDP